MNYQRSDVPLSMNYQRYDVPLSMNYERYDVPFSIYYLTVQCAIPYELLTVVASARLRTNISHIRVKMSGANFPDKVEQKPVTRPRCRLPIKSLFLEVSCITTDGD